MSDSKSSKAQAAVGIAQAVVGMLNPDPSLLNKVEQASTVQEIKVEKQKEEGERASNIETARKHSQTEQSS